MVDDTVRDNIADSINNYHVGFNSGHVVCSDCGTRTEVTKETGSKQFVIRVSNNPRSGHVEVGSVYCLDCEIPSHTPTQGIHEAIVEVTIEPNPVGSPVITDLHEVHEYSTASLGCV